MNNKKTKNKKIVVIIGPTASGKTGLGVQLALKYNGEIISSDSRQVYKGMDIGTGKDLKEYEIVQGNKKINIPYHLIDVVSPKTNFSLAKFQKLGNKAIEDILKRDKLPLIVGGTGLYAQSLVEGFDLSGVKPDQELRNELEKLEASQLFQELKKVDSDLADSLNNSDKNNKHRLIRYIERIKNQEQGILVQKKKKPQYDFLIIGLSWPKEVLFEKIYKRLIERLEKENMIGEVERLHDQGVSWKRLLGFGLEYKYLTLYLQKKISYDEMVEQLFLASKQYTKRQMTWFRRWEKQGVKINWLNDKKKAEELVEKFLQN